MITNVDNTISVNNTISHKFDQTVENLKTFYVYFHI